jgi:hypothetical protein
MPNTSHPSQSSLYASRSSLLFAPGPGHHLAADEAVLVALHLVLDAQGEVVDVPHHVHALRVHLRPEVQRPDLGVAGRGPG